MKKFIFFIYFLLTVFVVEAVDFQEINEVILEEAKCLDVNFVDIDNEEAFLDPNASLTAIFSLIYESEKERIWIRPANDSRLLEIRSYPVDSEGVSKAFDLFWLASAIPRHPLIAFFGNVVVKIENEDLIAYSFSESSRIDVASLSKEKKQKIASQYLEVLEHLLLHQVVPLEFFPEDFLVSPKGNLLFSGWEHLHQAKYLSSERLRDVLDSITNSLKYLGPEIFTCCQIPENLRGAASGGSSVLDQLPDIFEWVSKLREELFKEPLVNPLYVFCKDTEDLIRKYEEAEDVFEGHHSCATGQSFGFLALEILARTLYQRMHPHSDLEPYLPRFFFLRYPKASRPTSVEKLFSVYPLRSNYDVVCKEARSTLLSVSPSLKERELSESAFATFESNDRGWEILPACFDEMFQSEHVDRETYEKPLADFCADIPASDRGIVTQIFLSRDLSLNNVLYRSLPCGIPYRKEEKIEDFFERYRSSLVKETSPQLRLIPWGLNVENACYPDRVHMRRYTLIGKEAHDALIKRADETATAILHAHRERSKELLKNIVQVDKEPNLIKKDLGKEAIVKRYCSLADPFGALFHIKDIRSVKCKLRSLKHVLLVLLKERKLSAVEALMRKFHGKIPDGHLILAGLALQYIEEGKLEDLLFLIDALPESREKNGVCLVAMEHFPEDKEEWECFLSDEYAQSLADFMAEGGFPF